MKINFLLLRITIFLLLLTSCSSSKQTLQYEGDPEMKATLKVMYPPGEESFMTDYGDLFKVKFPNIEIQVIGYWNTRYKEVMQEEKPDVIALSIDEYTKFIEEDRLYDLNLLFLNDKFDLDGINPNILDYLRQLGGGKIYGLPPKFLNRAIYYNKDLFDKNNVPYPHDQMTWEEIIQLSKRFSSGDEISGLYMQSFATSVNEIATSRGLSFYNAKDKKITVNTESYKKVFELVLDAYNSKSIVLPGIDSLEVYDPFITGTSAMTMDYYYYINNKINWAKEEQGSKFHLNWDLASAPVGDESRRGTTSYFNFANIFSVNSESEQKQAAWELVKFINGEELAKKNSKTPSFATPTRTDYLYNPEGKRIEAFYNQRPEIKPVSAEFYSSLPNGFFTNMDGIINSELKAVTVGVKTLDEAMASMQERGQRLLDEK